MISGFDDNKIYSSKKTEYLIKGTLVATAIFGMLTIGSGELMKYLIKDLEIKNKPNKQEIILDSSNTSKKTYLDNIINSEKIYKRNPDTLINYAN